MQITSWPVLPHFPNLSSYHSPFSYKIWPTFWPSRILCLWPEWLHISSGCLLRSQVSVQMPPPQIQRALVPLPCRFYSFLSPLLALHCFLIPFHFFIENVPKKGCACLHRSVLPDSQVRNVSSHLRLWMHDNKSPCNGLAFDCLSNGIVCDHRDPATLPLAKERLEPFTGALFKDITLIN